jgi:hypothetical protein
LARLFQPVFHEQVQVVALVKNLAFDLGVDLAQPADLAVLLGDQLLVQRGDLDEQVVLRQIEVGSEPLGRDTVVVPFDVERARFVLPFDLIEVEQSCELPF